MIILATGNGKGKTTAAIGQAIRAVGGGRRVFFAQFIKSDSYASGEDAVLRGMSPQVEFLKGGLGFVGILGDKIPFAEHRAAAVETLRKSGQAAGRGFGLIVLDEVNVALSLKLIELDELLEFLSTLPEGCDAVLTGRNADEEIVRRADFVTECVEVKHPFRRKVKAKKGIEY